MKSASLGDYLLWNGKPAKVIGETSSRMVIIELLEDCKCPHCKGSLGKEQIHSIVSSPQFQESAQKLETIIDDPSIVVC
jgi:hypothetical protein